MSGTGSVLNRFRCFLGLHEWQEVYQPVLQPDGTQEPQLTLVCRVCGKTQVVADAE